MSISYDGYNTKYLTMLGKNVTVGSLVKIGLDNEAIDANDNDEFVGIAIAKRGDIVSVQESGYVELKYTGQKPVCGYCNLIAADKNSVKFTDAVGKLYKVVKVDENTKTVGFII